MKYSIVKSKQKTVRTFSGSTCFQAATESYCPANNNTRAKLVPYNPSDECTFEKGKDISKQKETRIYYIIEKKMQTNK